MVTVYKVVKGDTLSALAARFGTTVKSIATANAIKDPNKLKVGQEIVIQSSAPIAREPTQIESGPRSTTATPIPPPAAMNPFYAAVQQHPGAAVVGGILLALSLFMFATDDDKSRRR